MMERVRKGQINPYSATRQLIENPQAVTELLRRERASKPDEE